MSEGVKNLALKIEHLDAEKQAEVVAFVSAKAAEPYIMSEAEIAACEEGEADIKAGRFAPADALEKQAPPSLQNTHNVVHCGYMKSKQHNRNTDGEIRNRQTPHR